MADAFETWFRRICEEDSNPAGLWKVHAIAREAFAAGAQSVSVQHDGCNLVAAEPASAVAVDPLPALVERVRRAHAAATVAEANHRRALDHGQAADREKEAAWKELRAARDALLKAITTESPF